MGKGPTRTQGPGKPSEHIRRLRKHSRESDPHKGQRRGGFHSPEKKQYTRKRKHKGQTEGEELTPIDETYRRYNFPIADLNWDVPAKPTAAKLNWSVEGAKNWSEHECETFKDTGEKGLHPAWGLKSIIDRGTRPHEKPKADKNISLTDETQTRKVPGKKFKSYSWAGELPATGRPCGEGEDPREGHCNPNLPPEEGGGTDPSLDEWITDDEPISAPPMHPDWPSQQKALEQELGRPLNVQEFMTEKKKWETSQPERAAKEKEDFQKRRAEELKRVKEEKRQMSRDYRQSERGDFGPSDWKADDVGERTGKEKERMRRQKEQQYQAIKDAERAERAKKKAEENRLWLMNQPQNVRRPGQQ